MIIFDDLEKISEVPETAIALGNFDGVHLGHQKLIGEAVRKAKEKGIKSAVFTFSNHPRDLVPGTEKVKNILYSTEKAEVIESLGIDYLFSIPFTKEIMAMSPESFIQELLCDKFNAKVVVCGFNYNFGYKAQGTPEILQEIGKKKGFEMVMIPPCKVDGNVVSSTLIREFIADGKMEDVKKYMGRNYIVSGEVVVGNRLGRRIGFPTSNLVIEENMVTPPNGVYVTLCEYNDKVFPGITNVGVKPTIGNYNKNIETHIFNFDQEIYGKKIKVEFIKKMREEIKFDNVEALSRQIKSDCLDAEAFHRANGYLL